MIGVRDFSASLGGQPVLRGVTFHAGAGELVALVGPNGAGKTTLLRALAGLLPGTSPNPAQVAYVEQGARCAWGITVRQLAALGRIPHQDADARAIEHAMECCGVTALADRRLDQLSGGQARRAMLARALATGAETLLLDEPVADLDPAAAHAMMRLLADFAAAGGCVVAVLHALDLASLYATRLALLRHGELTADGPAAQVLPAAAAAFGMIHDPEARPLLRPAPPTP